jgi:UPF0755 protein
VRFLKITAVLAVLLAVAAGGAYFWFIGAVVAPGPLQSPATIIIAPGTGLSAIARQLTTAGVIPAPWMAVVEARRTGQDRTLKPGEYRFEPGVSLTAALDKIVRHDVVARFVTVPEGLTTAEVRAIIAGAEGLTGDLTAPIADGDLLPETYRYEWGDTRDGLIARMRAARAAALKELWEGRQQGLPLASPEEALVLASIVEKETGLTSERARVAAVFINRLRLGMRLQSDPTVLYGVPGGDAPGRAIRQSDLDRPTPFNTYAIPGLPPSPICHPGRAALAAVLNPAMSDELYFVADGSGGHAFAATLDGHNRNVARWRQIERQNRTQK